MIDILKMDCEGAEWELLEDINSWKKVRSLTLEYHLWDKLELIHKSMISLMNAIGFKILNQKNISDDQGLLVGINKNYLG